MLPTDTVKIVFGLGAVGDASDPITGQHTPEEAQEVLDIFRAHGGNELDGARGYSPNAPGTSEPIVGKTDFRTWATISSKVKSRPGDHTKAGIEQSTAGSLQDLGLSSLDINYLHHPDPETALEETVAAMDAEHRAGRIKQFGISNYSVEQVRQLLAICKEKGYVKPTVYQGQYNAIARASEAELIPLLRENGIKFYAWSPAAGGVFNKGSIRMTGTDGLSTVWQRLFEKPEIRSAFERIQKYEETAGISGHAVALRWVLHHSILRKEHGDAIVIGARTTKQLESTMAICEAGLLPEDIVRTIEDIWGAIQHAAPGVTLS